MKSVANTSALHRPGRIPFRWILKVPNQDTARDWETGAESPQDAFPLSLAQEGLWVLERISPGRATYNVPEAWRFKGALNLDALQASFQEIVNRHETLRTTFSEKNGKPVQVVSPDFRFELPVTDISRTPDPEAECAKQLQSCARRPFDLEKGPLFSTHLFKLNPEEHVLLVNLHHIICDAWSFGVLHREFTALYEAFASGKGHSLSELPIHFADYAVWHREQLQGELLEKQLSYWQKKLAGCPELLKLPLDRPRIAVWSDRGSAEFFALSTELATKLKNLSRSQGVTLFMTLLAAFKTLLHRYTGETDLVVGSPFARRDRCETEGLIGYLVHTHALRTDLSGNPTFLEALKRVREVAVGAHNNQEINFESIVSALQPERNPSYHPFFQVVFGLNHAGTEQCQVAGLELTRKELETGTAKFDWTWLVTESAHGLNFRFEYSTDLFERETILRVASHFERLLGEIASHPYRKLSEFSFLTPEEELKLVSEWSCAQSEYEREASIPEMFERQVFQRPDAIALSLLNRQLTYGELNQRSNAVARLLQSCDVGPGVAVGLAFERSFELIIGMLGILKAGGIYVPLDTSYPAERLRFMTQEAGISLVLTDEAEVFAPMEIPKIKIVEIDSEDLENSQTGALGCQAKATDTAYIIYTSGSTGTPKGTLVPHRAVVRLVRNANFVEISNDDVFLQYAPATFDASTFEIWGCLLNGGKLVICPPGLLSFGELGRVIQHNKITILWLTAGLFHEMVDQEIESLRSLRFLLAGGDTLSVPHVQKSIRELQGELVNGYGPTENTTFSCCYRVPKNWQGSTVPIGRPISNSCAYVLDGFRHPVPIGVPGELYVGGDGLSQGYLNQAELTAENFVPNPFQDQTPGNLLYRTGDIVRWRPDGNIEFLGRADEQVKIRGFRVEPGEIEAVLKKHPGVAGALVLASGSGSQKALTAFVNLRPGSVVAEADLRLLAQQNLPVHMLPARLHFVEKFPLTSNGKVDRRALLQLANGHDESNRRQQFAAPQTAEEKQLAGIWEELLGRKPVGLFDDFFQLGGNSLLAMQVISRVATAFQVEMPVRVIFESPTVSGMTGALLKQRTQTSRAPIIQPIPRDRAAELLARLDTLSEAELEALLEETELKTV